MSKLSCPACGSEDVSEEQVEESLNIAYGPDAVFMTIQHACGDCGFCGDFTGDNSAIINAAVHESNTSAVANILKTLNAQGMSLAYISRALKIPMKIVTKWDCGDYSPEALALLRCLVTFPALLEIADNNFDCSIKNEQSEVNCPKCGKELSLKAEKYTDGSFSRSVVPWCHDCNE